MIMTREKKTRERILIVDDDPESLWPLAKKLEEKYEVLCATTGEQAIRRATSENSPDLILLDVMLPDIDGYQVCQRLKEQKATQDIPVIFLTAMGAEQEETKGFGLGAQDYIVKPYSMEKVNVRIRSVLNLKRELDRRSLLKLQLEELNARFERQVQEMLGELQHMRDTLQTYERKYQHLFQTRPGGGGKKRILVVDDIPENIHVLIGLLQSKFEVLCAASGKAALDIAFSENPPDLILLDIMMPGMDGYEVCSRLKANPDTWNIPVIFVTGMDQEIDETKGLDYGAVDFVTKPFSPPILQARVEAALRLKDEMDQRIVLTQKLEQLNKDLEDKVKLQSLAIRRASDDLLASEKKYQDIYENAPEGIFQSTFEGRFLTVNPALARILGYDSAKELIDQMADIQHQLYVNPEERDELKSRLLSSDAVFGFEFKVYRKNGDTGWVSINARVVRDNHGEPLHIEGFLSDITEKKVLEKQVRQSAKMEAIGTLVGGISHDFNNMITPIIGFTELLLKTLPAEDQSRHFLELVKKSGESAAALSRRLLAFSRKQVIQPRVVDLNQIIDDTHKILQSVLSKDIELVSKKQNNLGKILVDPGEIEQVIMNLAVNARDAMPQGGTLSIAASQVHMETGFKTPNFEAPPGDYIRMTISDTGTGMDSETKQHIFEPFFTTKDVGKGTGIGLATVCGIVKQYRGFISVESTLAKGSTFSVHFPISEATEANHILTTDIEARYQGKETVLVVENNASVCELAEAVLKYHGYTVLTADNGKKGRTIMDNYDGPLDLLLTDVVMANTSGKALYEELAGRFPGLKVIYMSGYTNELIVGEGVLGQGTEFLQKPFGVKTLAKKVRSVLDG